MLATMNDPQRPPNQHGPTAINSSHLPEDSPNHSLAPLDTAADQSLSEIQVRSVGPALADHHLKSVRPRRVWLPVILLIATCTSTFWAAVMSWEPMTAFGWIASGLDAGILARQSVLRHAGQGLVYMISVIGILFAHEMGHFVATLIYRIPASLPYFIPFPIAPFGTMGAVIGMQGHRANRREIFDIGLAGPLAGLVLAVPILWIGSSRLDLTQPAYGTFRYELPLLAQWIYTLLHPHEPVARTVASSQVNALFMAGWVGLLITGLNMLPVSQLDGGHVVYTLFGRNSRWIARSFVVLAVVYMVWARVIIWFLMLILVLIIGIDHPRTADDSVKLGWPRIVLGYVSLLIPILCFPPGGITPVGP